MFVKFWNVSTYTKSEIPLLSGLKSLYKHTVARSHRSSKESGRRSWSTLWCHQWRSFFHIFCADDVKREIQTWDSCMYFTVVSQSEVRVSTEHGIKHDIAYTAWHREQLNGLVQERRNSSALAMELRLSCANPLRWLIKFNSLTPERCNVVLNYWLSNSYQGYVFWVFHVKLRWMPQDLIGADNGLVLPGTKPLTEPKFTRIYATKSHH